MASITLTVKDSLVPTIRQIAVNRGYTNDVDGIRNMIINDLKQAYITQKVSEAYASGEVVKQQTIADADEAARTEVA